MQKNAVEVAIVGAGPVGLTLAALLVRSGAKVAVYERREDLHAQPQAHVVNTRTMEVFRDLGVDRKIAAAAAPMAKMRFITWCESLAGREFGRLSLMGDDPSEGLQRLSLSPAMIVNLAQNRLEPILYDRLTELGGAVSFGHEVTSVQQQKDGVKISVRSRDGSEFESSADYVVACDGAGSGVRRGLGIEMVGPISLQTFISIYFTANLDKYLGGRSGPIQWIAGPDVRGVVIGFDLSSTWALMCPYGPPNKAEEFTEEVAHAMVLKAIGDPAAEARIDAIRNWNMSAQVAESYGSGRIYLAGDAAHRFPPSGGLGMNTGIQDTHNLAWKLLAVLKGKANEQILSTYETERLPIAMLNCQQSLGNSMKMIEVDAALGASSLAPVTPDECKGPSSPFPDLGLDGDTQAARQKRQAVADAIAAQAEHFDFPGIDFGVRYETGALCPDGSEPVPPEVRQYTPDTRPGSRLPHFWLRKEGKRTAIYDLVPRDGFLLVAGPAGDVWRKAAEVSARRLGIEVRVIIVAEEGGDFQHPSDGWKTAGGPFGSGAVLVRPDHHVAWKSLAAGSDPQAQLTGALWEVLGLGEQTRPDTFVGADA